MKIELIDPPGNIFADGFVTGFIREQATPFLYIVIGLRVGLPSEVTLGEVALSTIVRAIKESKVERIRDILR
jgi:hypothetical protein